jgi:type IV secretion system protein VirB10
VRKEGKGADLPRPEPARVQPAATGTGSSAQGDRQEEQRPGLHGGRAWINRNRAFTLPRGTPIHCLPDGPITSASRGDVTCMVDRPVWSEDGSSILLDAGAVIEGTVGQGLQNGERRLFVAWDRARGTSGERIPLAGVGASSLGENGIDGILETHLWERIRAGLLLTVLETGADAAVAAAGSAAAGGGGNTILSFGQRAGGSARVLAQGALQHDYNRPNTLRRDHADGITVKLTADVDLSGVYRHGLVREARP